MSSGGKKEPFAQLTSREREVLVQIAEGKSNKEIADRLGIGVRTIETHRERIMRRLNIHSVAGLTKYAIANGLISLEGGPPPPVTVVVSWAEVTGVDNLGRERYHRNGERRLSAGRQGYLDPRGAGRVRV